MSRDFKEKVRIEGLEANVKELTTVQDFRTILRLVRLICAKSRGIGTCRERIGIETQLKSTQSSCKSCPKTCRFTRKKTGKRGRNVARIQKTKITREKKEEEQKEDEESPTKRQKYEDEENAKPLTENETKSRNFVAAMKKLNPDVDPEETRRELARKDTRTQCTAH